MHVIEYIMSALAPHRCLACAQEGSLLCDHCSSQLPLPPKRCFKCGDTANRHVCDDCLARSGLASLYVATHYQGTAKALVHHLKFGRAPAAATPMAQLLSGHIREYFDAIIPIPTATSRVRQRGYDQAALLARQLAQLTGYPYTPLLGRRGQARQVGQSRKIRERQLQNAFYLRHQPARRDLKILLIDDVITTGSTAEAATAALREAGMQRVSAAFFAVRVK